MNSPEKCVTEEQQETLYGSVFTTSGTPLTAHAILFDCFDKRRRRFALLSRRISKDSEFGCAMKASSSDEPAYSNPANLSSKGGSAKSVHWAPLLISSERPAPAALSFVPPKRTLHKQYPLAGAPPRKLMHQTSDDPSSCSDSESLAVVDNSFLDTLPDPSEVLQKSSIEPYPDSYERAAELWVVVFGFFPMDPLDVVQYFSRVGSVVTYKCAKPTCNWMYLRFARPFYAREAVARKSAFLNNSIRIGMLPLEPSELEKLGFEPIGNCALKSPPSFSPPPRSPSTFHNVAIPTKSPSDSALVLPPDMRTVSANGILETPSRENNELDNYYRVDTNPNWNSRTKDQSFLGRLWSYIY